MAKDFPRIAVFDDWLVFHIRGRTSVVADDPSSWAMSLDYPRLKRHGPLPDGGSYYTIEDPRALYEVERVVRFRSCAICRNDMVQRDTWVEDEQICVCLTCGYWAGLGFREWNSHQAKEPRRAAIGRYSALAPLDAATTEYLVTHLRRFPRTMPQLSPRRAESFVLDLMSEVLSAEVRSVGGPGDGGVDGYVVSGDEVRSIVQVKWRKDLDIAESVSVIREVAGTLLARGIPHGILVSSRERFSPAATKEAEQITGLEVKGIGHLKLDLVNYHQIIDMLELTNRRLTASMDPDDWFPAQAHEDVCVFDGASVLTEAWVERHLSGWTASQ